MSDNTHITSDDISPENEDHWLKILRPWIVREYPATSLTWRWERFLEVLHWRGKIIKSRLKLLSISGYRTFDHVNKTYKVTWSKREWPRPHKPRSRKDRTLAEWRGEGLVLALGAFSPMHLERIMHVIKLTRPQSVLEVGAGMGLNLLPLAGHFPEIEFSGLELTEEGVARAKSVQNEAKLPDVIQKNSPFKISDLTAHRKINFVQGNAIKLPFEDNYFDLVFSRLAIEQMELVRDEAISEMVRVSKHAVLMIEPFADFNKDSHRALAIRAKNFFSLSTTEVQDYGLELKAVLADWPQKLSEGTGLAYYLLK